MSHNDYWLYCACCDWVDDGSYVTHCPLCGGLIEAGYALPLDPRERRLGSQAESPVTRFAQLLPVTDQTALGRCRIVGTPLMQMPAEFARGIRVACKIEGRHPTGSCKDPMCAVALAHMAERGVRRFVFSSTGNTAASMAWAIRQWPELTAILIAPAGFPAPADAPANFVVERVDADYAQSHAVVQRVAHERGAVNEGGFFSVARREGLKIAYLDAITQMARSPTVVIQAVSSGMGILAARAACQDLLKLGALAACPRLIAVQQATCAPMVSAYAANTKQLRPHDIVQNPDGLAVATLLGDPTGSYPYVQRAVRETGGMIVAVESQDIKAARHTLLKQGVDACYSSATALAAVPRLAAEGWLSTGDVVLVNLTGSRRSLAGQAEHHQETANARPGVAAAPRSRRQPGLVHSRSASAVISKPRAARGMSAASGAGQSRPQHPSRQDLIVCFPWAGAPASVFGGWRRLIPDGLDLLAWELPGRGRRVTQPPLKDMSAAVAEAVSEIEALTPARTVLFGHSLGALIAFETARALHARGRTPAALYVSGCAPPDQRPDADKPTRSQMDSLIRDVHQAPSHVQVTHELAELFYPVLVADHELLQTYRFQPGAPISSPLTIFFGSNDQHTDTVCLERWAQFTTGHVRYRAFAGGHFFVTQHTPTIVDEICASLTPYAPTSSEIIAR